LKAVQADYSCPVGHNSYIDIDYTKIYCTRLIGYRKKKTFSLVLNQSKQNAILEEIEQAKQQESEIQAAIAEIDKGKRALALFKVLNQKKGLTPQQRGKLLSDSKIKDILDALNTGSIPVAVALINSFPADGILVTEQDKQKLISELQK
jgi:nitric oxide reductase large subunit